MRYIEDPDPELSHWTLVGMRGYIDMETSDIWFGQDEEPEFNLYIDTKEVINDYLHKDETLTKECQAYFEESPKNMWCDKIAEWVKSKGQGWGVKGSGNTYSGYDPSYFWGDTFEYTYFEDADGHDGIIIMMHNGGDVRGNYSYPVVYYGDYEEFMNMQHIGDPDQEISDIFGYEYYDNLVYDMKKYRGTTSEEDEPKHEEPIPGQMRWNLEGENPAETYTESKMQIIREKKEI